MEFAALIRRALDTLSARRPLIHSEADLQHELALQIVRLDPDVEVRMERPVRLHGTRPINLDVMLQRDGQRYALELKYITAKLDVAVDGEEFLLKSQAAQDLRRYDILKDVTRIEQLVEAGVVLGGMSVTITNDRSLWQETRKIGTVDQAFRLHQGRIVTGNLAWAEAAAAGTMRGREASLNLAGSYTLDWEPYSRVPAPKNGEFRKLIVEVSPDPR